jgi:hypothetical protein
MYLIRAVAVVVAGGVGFAMFPFQNSADMSGPGVFD